MAGLEKLSCSKNGSGLKTTFMSKWKKFISAKSALRTVEISGTNVERYRFAEPCYRVVFIFTVGTG